MAKEKPEFELNRLRTELRKARQDEIFGGLSPLLNALDSTEGAGIYCMILHRLTFACPSTPRPGISINSVHFPTDTRG
jgi:hypothetical protein